MEDAAAAFLWHVVYRVKSPERPIPAPRSPKKLYPADPFVWHTLVGWATGSRNPWADSIRSLADPARTGLLVESVVGDHLKRRRGPFTLYHRAAQGSEEIDFVSFDGAKRALVEVKYRRSIKSNDKKWLRKHGGGILVTRSDRFLNEDQGVAGIPAPAFLAGLEGPTTLFPAVE